MGVKYSWCVALCIVFVVCVMASEEDSPYDAWEEWGETKESKERERVRPKRQPQVEMQPGKKINVDALMGSIPKKMMLFFVNGDFGDEVQCNTLAARWRDQMRIGGVDANIGCVASDATIVGRAESKRDVYNAKDFLLRFPQVKSVKIDHQEFTEPTQRDDDDDDDDEL